MANEGQHRLTQAHSNQRRPMQAYEDENWPKRPYLHHYPHHHQPPTITTPTTSPPAAPPAPPSPGLETRLGPFFVIIFTTITITGARDTCLFLFILFYFILHRGRDASRALVCFILFYFYSFYFTGTEMRLGPLFFFFCYRSFYFTRARDASRALFHHFILFYSFCTSEGL